MDTTLFKNRQFPEDLEVKTLDDQLLYVNKNWLCLHSGYFKALLTNGCKESYIKHIEFAHNCIVLETIFNWLCFGYTEETVNIVLSKIDTIDLLYDLFNALEEYCLATCKKSAEKFYSTEDMTQILLKTKCDHSLIDIIFTFNLEHMKKTYIGYINSEKKWIYPIAINAKLEQIVKLKPNWHTFTTLFLEWSTDRDPTNEELEPIIELDYDNASRKDAEKLTLRIRKFTKADQFKKQALFGLSYSLFPGEK